MGESPGEMLALGESDRAERSWAVAFCSGGARAAREATCSLFAYCCDEVQFGAVIAVGKRHLCCRGCSSQQTAPCRAHHHNHQISAIICNHLEVSVVNPQSSVISLQSSSVNYQSSIISHQSSVISHPLYCAHSLSFYFAQKKHYVCFCLFWVHAACKVPASSRNSDHFSIDNNATLSEHTTPAP